jgi:hypothetical protein
MFRYIPDGKLDSLSKKDVITISHMANMSVNLSRYYLPRKFFIEMDFTKKTAFLEVDSKKLFENKTLIRFLI